MNYSKLKWNRFDCLFCVSGENPVIRPFEKLTFNFPVKGFTMGVGADKMKFGVTVSLACYKSSLLYKIWFTIVLERWIFGFSVFSKIMSEK